VVNIFETIISTFLENRIGISNEFLNADLAFQLKSNLIELYEKEALKQAGIGNKTLLTLDKDIRRDKIHWLDKKHQNKHESAFFELIDDFVSYLNKTCYSGIKSYEFHYTLYEKGAFYKKHFDQFKTDDSRAFSMVIYLNKGWQEGNGGELKIYTETGFEMVSPDNQKCVFFKSNELEHEVLVTNETRMSITGWLKTSI